MSISGADSKRIMGAGAVDKWPAPAFIPVNVCLHSSGYICDCVCACLSFASSVTGSVLRRYNHKVFQFAYMFSLNYIYEAVD